MNQAPPTTSRIYSSSVVRASRAPRVHQPTTQPKEEAAMSRAALDLIPGGAREAPPSADEDLWDVKRAAQFLGLSVDGVYRAAERGDLPSVRILNRRKFIPSELRAWAVGQRGRPGR
jgi:hypothetical protein